MWEGLRLYDGVWAFLDEDMDRLFGSLKSVSLDPGMRWGDVVSVLYRTAATNQAHTDAHCRLMITRGLMRP